jgi:2-aminobenzoate-CoA ligase
MMTEIPAAFLPPVKFLPKPVRLLPELNYPEHLNLAEVLLDNSVQKRGEKNAIYYKDECITYRELQYLSNRFANALKNLGITKNDRVMIRSPNIPEYIVWNFACWRIGAIPVLINHLNRHEELAFKANDSEAIAICVDESTYGEVEKARKKCPSLKYVIVYGKKVPDTLSYEELVENQSDKIETEITNINDIGRLIYSSGTTGKPKGIITTVGGILSAMDTHGKHVLKITEDDVLGGHPFFTFAFGSVNFTFHPWRFGASISVISRFDPEEQLRLVQTHRITMLFAVPTAFRMMLGIENAEKKYDLSSLRLCQSAGEWLPGATIREWKDRFGMTIIDSLGSGDLNYWMSTYHGMPEEKTGSTGISVPGYENIVVDESFYEVPSNELGELIVRGPLGQTYWRRPDKQKEGVCPPDSKYAGWSRPGLVFLKDDDGFFWYKSRSDDLIVTSGYKIPGGEVEAALNNHPAVMESAVIDSPNKTRGNVVKAFVILKDGYQPSDSLAKELQDFVKEEIEPYKYPRIIEFAESEALPRTSTGKIQRRVLRDKEHALGEQKD